MRISQIAACLALAVSTAHAASLPNTDALSLIEEHAASIPRSDILAPENALEKRKGGGGKGGGGSSGGGKSGGSSGGGKSGSKTSTTSNEGGATRSGSGPARAYGGGGYYGGGAGVPYASGQKTPKGLLPGALLGTGLALAIFPGFWLWRVYPYYFNNHYRFLNQTIQNATNPNGANVSLPVACLCEQFSSCGCDENDNQQYLNDLVGNGSYKALNKTLVTVSEVNNTTTLVLNGTLPNGTTAPGGTDDAAASLSLGQYSGYWVMGLIVLYTAALP